jgi:hypothetical protein
VVSAPIDDPQEESGRQLARGEQFLRVSDERHVRRPETERLIIHLGLDLGAA